MNWQFFAHPTWILSGIRDITLDLLHHRRKTEFAQLYREVRPYTMSGHARLRALYHAVRQVIAHDVPGVIVECGTAQGGSAALMALTLQCLGANREVWVFDTFNGLPPPSAGDPDWKIAQPYTGRYAFSVREVEETLARLDILQKCKLVKGLFQETLPRCQIEKIAVLHLDCDWYDSMRCCLENLYDRVSPGGIIQIDDYGHWQGARKAVDEFLRDLCLDIRLKRIDYTGRQFVKPGPVPQR